ncbi:hypothetical protein CHU92_03530, partial [Flavobacterium cyanobacteriorum]
SGYSPNQAFQLYPYALGREEADTATNTDVLVFHGATDAPAVDVVAEGAGVIVNDITYGNYIANYLELPTDNYTLNVTTADGTTVVASYSAPLETLDYEGDAITILASGFLNPANNSNGPEFGLWAATAAGGPLLQLPQIPLSNREFRTASLSLYPNPAKDVITIEGPYTFNSVTAKLYDLTGRQVLISTDSTINISGLGAGIYVLDATIDGSQFTEKIIVRD